MRESADLEQWINEQLQTAMSEEYGDDYEHFKVCRASVVGMYYFPDLNRAAFFPIEETAQPG